MAAASENHPVPSFPPADDPTMSNGDGAKPPNYDLGNRVDAQVRLLRRLAQHIVAALRANRPETE